MARRKNLPQYSVVVSASLPKNVELGDVRISQKVFELVKGYTVKGNTLVFEKIANTAALLKLIKIIESSGLAKFKVKPSYTVTKLSYSGTGRPMPDCNVASWTNAKAKDLVQTLKHQLRADKKYGSQWHLASEFQVTVAYPGNHYFNGGDAKVRRAMGRSDVSSGMGGERDISFDFSRVSTMTDAIKRLQESVPFKTHVYVTRNVYDGRGYWEEGIDVVKRSSAEKALEKLKQAA